MCMDNLSDALTRESFLSETSLNIIQYFSVRGVGVIQDVPEVEVCRTQPITEVLSENPTAI